MKEIEQHLKDYSSVSSEKTKIKSVKQLLAEIRQLRRKTELVSNIPDLPAPIVGTFRNEENNVGDGLIKLDFTEEDLAGGEYHIPGFTRAMIEHLEKSAVTLQFNNAYIQEIKIEYNEK